MYLPTPRLKYINAITDNRPIVDWPFWDSTKEVAKFTIQEGTSGPLTAPEEQAAWWKAQETQDRFAIPDENAYQNLHFSPNFISFLDSDDGLTWKLYAPKVETTEEGECQYKNSMPIFSDDGFRAGWNPTSIRCEGASKVYHDPTVVYLSELGRYLMFVVECEASNADGEPGPSSSPDCIICVKGGVSGYL
jgi:hypothetical protein